MSDDVPLPRLVSAGSGDDAVIAVELAGVCGSDLHLFFGREDCANDVTMGHEAVGIVVALGAAAAAAAAGTSGLALGDRVITPFTTACGECPACARGLSARCCKAQLLGFRAPESSSGLEGCQAEYVRVPLAASSLVCLPSGVSASEGLLLGDIFSTGTWAAVQAGALGGAGAAGAAGGAVSELAAALDAAPAETSSLPAFLPADASSGVAADIFVVVGCGPVGLCAVYAMTELLRLRGRPARLFACDAVESRLSAAAAAGAEPLRLHGDGSAASDATAAIAAVRTAAGGAGGAAAVLECVGAPAALALAFEILRPGGVLSSVGVNTAPTLPFSPADAYDKNLTFRVGRCPARSMLPQAARLLARLRARGVNIASTLITHRLPLSSGAEAYALFSTRAPGCVKVVLDCVVPQ